jgi:GT2 family glycosyltransferase
MQMDGVSVVICSFTLQRWDDLQDAVRSVRRQTVAPLEVVVVADSNPALLERIRAQMPDVVAVANKFGRGASGARNSGVGAARGSVVAFLDDDAVADEHWLERLVPALADERFGRVLGAGGWLRPRWSGLAPRWFPAEFYWVVGGSYRGLPTGRAEIRNVWAGNMAIRRDVFDAVGGFRQDFGKIGARARPEDTDLCLRTRAAFPGAVWMLEPAAAAEHKVPADRATLRYYLRRCYAEGVGKAELVALSDGDAMSDERRHALRALPLGVARGLADTVTGRDAAGILRSAAIVAGLAVAAAGRVAGAVALRRTERATSRAGQHPALQPAPASPVPPAPAENPDHASAA